MRRVFVTGLFALGSSLVLALPARSSPASSSVPASTSAASKGQDQTKHAPKSTHGAKPTHAPKPAQSTKPAPSAKPAQGTKPAPSTKPAPAVKKPVEAVQRAPTVIAIGKPVDPGHALVDLDGKRATFGDLRGKTVLFTFWSPESKAAQAYDGRLARIAADYAKRGVVLYAVVPTDVAAEGAAARLREASQKAGVPWTLVPDPRTELAQRFGVHTLPEVALVDAKGVLRYRGAIDDDPAGEKADTAARPLREALEAVLAGKDVLVTSLPAHGDPLPRPAAARPASAPSSTGDAADAKKPMTPRKP